MSVERTPCATVNQPFREGVHVYSLTAISRETDDAGTCLSACDAPVDHVSVTDNRIVALR